MQTITTIGLDIAKSVFQIHGIDAAGEVIIRRQSKLRSRRCWRGARRRLPPSQRSLCQPGTSSTGSPTKHHPCDLCEAVREGTKERLQRRRSDRRGRAAAELTRCTREDARSARPPSPPPRSLSPGLKSRAGARSGPGSVSRK
jgi:hypothetical protein